MIHRGELYWVNLDPTVGSEIKKTRPALVVSNDINNQHSNTVTVLPITSKADRVYPFEVAIKGGAGGLRDAGKIKADQIRTVDKARLSRQPIGPALGADVLERVDAAMRLHLGLS